MKVTKNQAVKILLEGGVVAIPTETVYGLAASSFSEKGITSIYSLKKRPNQNPLIVHVASVEQAREVTAEFPTEAVLLAKEFWPGPLTMVLPAREVVPLSVRAGLSTVGVRCPAHPLALDVIRETGPLVAPSANLSGKPSGTRASHIEEDFGADFPVLDGGSAEKGIESTILIYSEKGWLLGRAGAIPRWQIESVLGKKIGEAEEGKPICPGRMFKHYSPRAKLYRGGEMKGVVVGFSDRKYPNCTLFIDLGRSTNAASISYRLYEALRELDRLNVAEASLDWDFPEGGDFEAAKERLLRASSS